MLGLFIRQKISLGLSWLKSFGLGFNIQAVAHLGLENVFIKALKHCLQLAQKP